MYCIYCGSDGAATFCRTCGKRQGSLADDGSSGNEPQKTESMTNSDWVDCLNYRQILTDDSARKRIVAASARRQPGVTGEDVLAVLEAVVPGNIPLGKLTHAVVPIMDKLGIRTTSRSQATWQAEPGKVLLAFLCVLASRSLSVDEVKEQDDTCEITVKLPLGVITNPGRLIAFFEYKQGWVRLSLSVIIAGQWYDWGKSKKLVEQLLADIHQDLTDQNSGKPVVFQRVA